MENNVKHIISFDELEKRKRKTCTYRYKGEVI